jgi:hypothetical protein
MMNKKYAFMGGNPGCLPDYHSDFVYDTEEEARGDAIDFYELSEEEGTGLAEYCPLYVSEDRYHEIGAALVEIVSDMVEEEEGGNI